jgi:anthranilate phosphoribosyltransferase
VILREVISAEPGPHRDIVVANAAAALIAAGHTNDLKEAAGLAAESIDSGRARNKLEAFIRFTSQTA